MARRWLPFALLGLMASGCAGNLLIGSRALSDTEFWEPFDSQVMFGIVSDHTPGEGGGGVAVEWGATASMHTETIIMDVDLTASLADVFVGVRYPFQKEGSPTQAYVGGGVTSVTAIIQLRVGSVTESEGDQSTGLYLHGGFLTKIGETGAIGLDVRLITGTTIEIPPLAETDVDGVSVALVIGWGY